MFAFLKKFGRKSAPVAPPQRIPVEAVAPSDPINGNGAASAVGSPPALGDTGPGTRPAGTPPPIPPGVQLAKSRSDTPAPVPSVPSLIIELPLKPLWHKLNPDVLQLASGHPNGEANLRFPYPLLHAQLSKGAVRIPYAQLRQFSPDGLFPVHPDKDALEVSIPVSEILAHLKPEHLARRPNQKKIEVPDDIGPVFGPTHGSANGLRVLESKPAASAPSARSNVPPKMTPHEAPFPVPSSPAPIKPKPTIAAPAVAKIPTPSQPKPTPLPPPKVSAPPARKPASPVPPPPAPISPITPIAQSAEPTAEPSIPIAAPKLDPALASLRRKSSAEGTFTIAIMDLAAYWTEKGQNDLANLYRHTLEIPMSTLEASLRAGKLQFIWREVRPWVRLAPGNSLPTLPDDRLVEFPLHIIAPRFMEQRGLGKTSKRVEVSAEIPDLFEKKLVVRPPATPTPSHEVACAAPAANGHETTSGNGESNTAFITKALAGAGMLDFGEIFGQPDKKDWSMAEVTQKTMALRGVAGAILATTDGLLVAGGWQGNAPGESVAGFVPSMYNRMLQYSKELKLGEPTNFTLMIENTPLQIFKTGNSFLTVLGRPGENLPKAQLTAVAKRLAASASGN